MKRFYLPLLALGTLLLLGGYIFLTWLENPRYRVELKPQITNTFSNKKFLAPATSSALLIDDEIATAKAEPPTVSYTTAKGDDLLVLVNKSIGLTPGYFPNDLMNISNLVTAYPSAQMRKDAAEALVAMFSAAKSEGLNLSVVSAYRSYYDQERVFKGWVASAGSSSAESFSAHPGHSQHQLGTAVDLGALGQSPLSQSFANTKEGAWVENNAASFGFVLSYPKGKEALTGYMYEPWHYRYIGKENAQKMLSSGLILEAYLRKFGVW